MSLIDRMGWTTTSSKNDTMAISPQVDYLNKTGVGSEYVDVLQNGQYWLDAMQDMAEYKRAEFPVTTIFYNLSGGKKAAKTVKTWSEVYESDMWDDIKLTDLRRSTKKETWTLGGGRSSAYVTTPGYDGQQSWFKVTSFPSASTTAAIGNELSDTGNSSTIAQCDSNSLFKFGFNLASDYIIGKKEAIIRKLMATLKTLDYDITTFTDQAGVDFMQAAFSNGTSHPLYFSFDDIAYMSGSDQYQEHDRIVLLNKFAFTTSTATEEAFNLYFELDFSESNLEVSNTANLWINMQEICGPTTKSYDTDGTSKFQDGGSTRLSRMALIQNFSHIEDAIPEGSGFVDGGGFVFGKTTKQTYTRINQSKTWGITGSRLASQVQFIDDWQMIRKRRMTMYKQRWEALFFYAKSFYTEDSLTGYPAHSFGGLFDNELYPIKYLRHPIPALDSTTTPIGSLFNDWIKGLVNALGERREGDGNSITLACSKNLLEKINDWITTIRSGTPNVFGYSITKNSADPHINLNIPSFQIDAGIKTSLYFIHEPAFDYIPKFLQASTTNAGIPTYAFKNGISPRNIMVALDKTNMFMETLQPDKLEGNLQKPGENIFKEAMRGEHLVYFKFPRNFAIVDTTPES